MKQIIPEENISQITPEQLLGREFIAYKSQSNRNSGYCVLTKLDEIKYGFIPLNYPHRTPRYIGTSYKNAINKAAEKRDVRAFDTLEEMLEAIVNQNF